MIVASFVLMVISLTNRCYSGLNIPLEDRLKAPLVVDLNVSKLNKALAKYINSKIETKMKALVESEMKRLLDEKAAALTTVLETKMDTLKNEMMKVVDNSISSKLHDFSSSLTNLASGKSASQSTTCPSCKSFPASLSTNEKFADYTHTDLEKRPWLKVDLGKNYRIYKINIFNRKDCCGERLHDLDVKVGNTLNNMYLCGHFVGPARKGERVVIDCYAHPQARYIQLQIVKGEANILSVAEVVVLGTNVHQ